MSRPEEIAAALGKATKEGRGWKSLCPAHDDHDPSLSIDEKDGKILIKCRAGCDQADVIAALSKRGLWRNGADHSNGADGKQHVVATYYYHDENSDVLYRVLKWGPKKTFVQQPPDGNGGWRKGKGAMEGVRLVPYHLPELIAARANGTPPRRIYIVEGEKDADRLAQWGLIATTNVGGAGKWYGQIYNEYFIGSAAVVILDNDKPGRKHAEAVAQNLLSVTADVRILDLPGLPSKGDACDWVAAGGTREDLERLADNAPLFQPGQAASSKPNNDNELDEAAIDAEISRLASLSKLKYEQERAGAAKRLNIRATWLDKAVSAERDLAVATNTPTGQGRPLEYATIEPWPYPVDGVELLDNLLIGIRRHVILGEHAARAVVLWVMFTHVFAAAVHAPKLLIKSPEKGSGKTRLLETLAYLVPRPQASSHLTSATAFRLIEQHRPTLLVDEVDTFMRDNEELRGIFNSGFNKESAKVLRTVGDNFEVREFSTWCPQGLAGIGRMPDTIVDRSIVIDMKRKRPSDKVEPLRRQNAGPLIELGQKAARWAKDHLAKIPAAKPEMPDGISDRAQDAWETLLAIADTAGGQWPALGRNAAVALVGSIEDQSVGVQLLSDIRDAFGTKDRLSSSEMVAYLVGLVERPWPEFRRGHPITAAQMARLLKRFGISSSGTIRIRADDGKEVTLKGYYRKLFTEVDPGFRTIG